MTPAGPLPGKTTIARLGADGVVRLQFTSSCDLLAGVELRLGRAAASARGALRMTLVGEDGSTIIQREFPRTGLPLNGSWHELYFEPVVGSVGKRYALELRAIDNDPRASIILLGSGRDLPSEGGAVLVEPDLQGEVCFRYGCSEVAAGK